MIHCLDDQGHPISILDLCDVSLDVAKEALIGLHEEMQAQPQHWEHKYDCPMLPGVRVIIPIVRLGEEPWDKHPLEDPRAYHYGLHPDFGFRTCWFVRTDRTTIFPSLMYVVRPSEDSKPAKDPLALVPIIRPRNSYEALLRMVPGVAEIMDAVAVIRHDAALTKQETT